MKDSSGTFPQLWERIPRKIKIACLIVGLAIYLVAVVMTGMEDVHDIRSDASSQQIEQVEN